MIISAFKLEYKIINTFKLQTKCNYTEMNRTVHLLELY